MAPTEQITFYTATFSPYGQRVHIALEEAGAKYTLCQVNPHSRPEWYRIVSPFGKVPAIAFGGPEVPPEQPSSESAKVFESLALLEFLADIFPEAKLLPKDPVQRARARAFVSIHQEYVINEFRQVFATGTPADGFLAGLERLQSALPPSGFAAGEWSIADAAVTPFLARMELFLRADIGRYNSEDGERLRAAFASDGKLSRLMQYLGDLRARQSFKNTWAGDEQQIEMGRKLPIFQRKAQ